MSLSYTIILFPSCGHSGFKHTCKHLKENNGELNIMKMVHVAVVYNCNYMGTKRT